MSRWRASAVPTCGTGLQPTVMLAAGVVLAGVVAGIFWRVPETDDLGAEPAIYWTDARLAFDPEPASHGAPAVQCGGRTGSVS